MNPWDTKDHMEQDDMRPYDPIDSRDLSNVICPWALQELKGDPRIYDPYGPKGSQGHQKPQGSQGSQGLQGSKDLVMF